MVTPTRISPPGSIHKVTHRTVQGEFLLRPDPEVNQNILYLMGHMQDRHGIGFHTTSYLSNHGHTLLTDHLGDRLQRYNQDFFSLMGRSMNYYLNRSENFWSTSKPNCVIVAPTAEDIVDHSAYIIVNPVEAELVSHAKKWPGVRILASEMGNLALTVKRPEFFYDPDGGMPEETQVRFTMPKVWDATSEQLRTRIVQECNRREEEIRKRVAKEGRKFMGAKRVKRRSVHSMPKNPLPQGETIPHVACKDRTMRLAMLEWRKRREIRYHEVRLLLLNGVKDVVFPEGTFAQHFRGGAGSEALGELYLESAGSGDLTSEPTNN